MKENKQIASNRIAREALYGGSAVLLLAVGIGIGSQMHPKQEETQPVGYASNPAYEYMVSSAAWQTSA